MNFEFDFADIGPTQTSYGRGRWGSRRSLRRDLSAASTGQFRSGRVDPSAAADRRIRRRKFVRRKNYGAPN